MSYCVKYGQGCVLCLVKCVAFGDRLGIAERAGAKLVNLRRPDGTLGQLGAGVTMYKDTLAPWLKDRIEKEVKERLRKENTAYYVRDEDEPEDFDPHGF